MHPIFPLSIVKEREIFQQQQFVPVEDLCFYFELFLSGLKLKVTKESYYLYRITPGSLTSKKPIDNMPLIVDYLSQKYPLTKEEKNAFNRLIRKSNRNYIYNMFTYYLKKKDFKNALLFGFKHPFVFLNFFLDLDTP
ncbi:hypothetical protein [Caldisericum exile]|uniref:Glycosyltransferase family 2 protein n=1 Tax=Caldisericum exile (strain DSM 21853 / NBRC 104410 / AZM16c01) TaxID=511051 RepID=A0A7U6GFW8_CALEA|nr:hypothetical protein [Caldisericum exile]BAL81660.1 hypothetical protein CSE_15340 [Caldisericum exile AZM16c01]